MSTVIKSGNSPTSVQRVAFNLEDISQRANGYLDEIRIQAARIVVEAQKQAETVRRKAEEEGRQAAMRAAERVLDEKVSKKMESLLPAIRQMIDELADARQSWLKDWEKATVKLACAIAEKITRRQLEKHPDLTVELVREALEMAGGSPGVRIQMNPLDVESLGSQVQRLTQEFDRVATAQIVADENVAPGGCRLETRHGAIDQQFQAQLARIEAELTAGNED
jgi:flagellar assembly protein FliH